MLYLCMKNYHIMAISLYIQKINYEIYKRGHEGHDDVSLVTGPGKKHLKMIYNKFSNIAKIPLRCYMFCHYVRSC